MTRNRRQGTGRPPRTAARRSGPPQRTPRPPARRERWERRLAGPALSLHRSPRWAVGLAVAALLLAGLAVPGPLGALALLALLALLGGLLFLSWPRLGVRSRLLRLAVLGALVAALIRGIAAW